MSCQSRMSTGSFLKGFLKPMVHGIVVPVGTGVRTKTDVGLKTAFTRSRSCLGLNTLWSTQAAWA